MNDIYTQLEMREREQNQMSRQISEVSERLEITFAEAAAFIAAVDQRRTRELLQHIVDNGEKL